MQQGRFFTADVGAGPHPHLKLEVEGAAGDALAQQPLLTRLLQGQPQTLDRQRVLRPHVEVAVIGPHGIGGDRHPFQQPMGIALQHAAVHEGPGIALIGIAHHVAPPRRLQGHGVPLEAGGIATATPPPQTTAAHLLTHRLGAQLLQHAPQLGITAMGEGRLDALRIDDAAPLQHQGPLQPEKGLLKIKLMAGQGRVRRQRQRRHPPNLVHQSRGRRWRQPPEQTGAFRTIPGQQRPLTAKPQTADRTHLQGFGRG
jgi:hypothetical protein